MNVEIKISLNVELLGDLIQEAKIRLSHKGVRNHEMIVFISEGIFQAIRHALNQDTSGQSFMAKRPSEDGSLLFMGLKFKPTEGLPFKDFFLISCKQAEYHSHLFETIQISSVCNELTISYNNPN